MSHPSFSLPSPPVSPQVTSSRLPSVTARRLQRRSTSLGLDATITKLNLAAFFLHAAASIAFLVFLNAIQPFLIAQLGVTEREGALSGTLVFADESLSLVLTLLWGSAADLFGTRLVATLSFCFVSLGLFAYTLAGHAWPDLLYARLIFAVGGSGATTMLSAILASYSDPARSEENPVSSPNQLETGASERTSLLNSGPASRSEEDGQEGVSTIPSKSKSGRLAGLAGLFTGIGALFAVFSLLRLPVLLSRFHHGDPSLSDLHHSFWIVAGISLLVAVLLGFGLKPDDGNRKRTRSIGVSSASSTGPYYGSTSATESPPVAQDPASREARRQRLRSRLQPSRLSQVKTSALTLAKGTLSGFNLASQDSELVLAYLGGGLARSATIGTTVFVPLVIARYFYHSGRCPILPPDDSTPDELKRICREAYSLASALSGVIQLFALLLAPLIGYLSDAVSPVITLGSTSLVGTIAFAILGISLSGEGSGDPRSPLAWISAVCVGICQIGAIVSSLILIQRAKARAGDKTGGIAGAYSCTGGLSVLFTSRLGGFLFDMYSPSPFLLIAGISLTVTLASAVVHFKKS